MGVVYKARDLHLDRSVAIKILPAEAMAEPERFPVGGKDAIWPSVSKTRDRRDTDIVLVDSFR